VFTREEGTPLHPSGITGLFRQRAFQAGLPAVALHGLRHGSATYLLAAGVDVKVVQARLGHSTSTLTRDTYTDVDADP
jgi:site-specific recombinase XerD